MEQDYVVLIREASLQLLTTHTFFSPAIVVEVFDKWEEQLRLGTWLHEVFIVILGNVFQLRVFL